MSAGADIDILVVDDESSVADAVSEVLTWEGYRVRVAPNGARALELMRAHRPTLVLTDYMMPLLDGLQLLREIKSDALFAEVPVILFSAAPLQGHPGTEKATAVLTKPFEIGSLLEVIERVLSPGRSGEG